MPRAFLSHSTDDKTYVEEVAQRLGRHRARIDTHSFRPGEDFRDAIRRTLDESEVLVLFVSRTSLASSWVKFELEEAELRSLRGRLRRALAIFIDGPVDASALPQWLAQLKAVQHATPGHSARTIESLLLASAPEAQRPMLGRNEDLQRGVRKITSGEPPPRLFIISGLEGIGRRSYLSKLVADALSLDLGPVMPLPSTATLEDLYLESHQSSTMLTRAEAESELAAFRGLTEHEQAREVADQLVFLAKQGTAPCIVDKGAMLDSIGRYRDVYAVVLEQFVVEADVHLALAHTRAPDTRNLSVRPHVFDRRLRPLPQPDAQALVSRLLRDGNITATPEQTARLGEVTGGYPPAAYFLVSQVENYGVDVVLGDESRIRDFNSRSFSRFLRDLDLAPVEQEILRYLASETSLSLAGIAVATGHALEHTAATIRQLVDLCIVEVQDDEYSVTAPIQATVLRNERGLGRGWYERAFERLEVEFWSDARAFPPISVVDATLRAGLRTGRQGRDADSSFVRPSLLVNAAQEAYHRRDFTRALEYLDRAEAMGGTSPVLLEFKIRSLAQLRQFRDARAALKNYRESGERRQWYLDGFIERKAGNHEQACSRFQRGYAIGDRSISLLRDYADSLLRTEALEEAKRIAREALDRKPGDIYVLDLIARVEIAAGSHEDAEHALDELEAADIDQQLILHRRASYLLHRLGASDAVRRAVRLAREATSKRDAPLEAYVVLARALIRSRDWEGWKAVKEDLGTRRTAELRGVLRRLDLEAALERGEWRRAEQLVPRQPRTAEDRRIITRVLDLKSNDKSLLLKDRKDAQTQMARLRRADQRDYPPPPIDLATSE